MDQLEKKSVEMKDVTSKMFDKEISSSRASVVKFWAPWCMPCKQLAVAISRVLPDLESKYQGQLNFLQVNVDEESELAQKFSVMTLPTVIGFSGTNPIERFTGRTEDEFVKWVHRVAQRAGIAD
ncbi:MAG: thioredoxin family protein [Bacillota bacterium]|jgi:thioredoxin 1|nr:thioredoxin family protein [Candidatus Fermentithermobacillaceae bacterium]